MTIDRRTSRCHATVVSRMGPAYSEWADLEVPFTGTLRFSRCDEVLGKGKYSVVYACEARPAPVQPDDKGVLQRAWESLFPPNDDLDDDQEEDEPRPPRQLGILTALSSLSVFVANALHSPSTPPSPSTDPSKPVAPKPSPSRRHPSAASTITTTSSTSHPKPNQFVLKLFRPDKTAKLKREILILQHLSDAPNIVQFIDCLLDPLTQSPGIVLARCANVPDWRLFYRDLGYDDVRFWVRELIKALAYTHQHGIIHRDVKPQNICIDPIGRKLVLIDYGLADFYIPHQPLNLRVASRFYKPPEILLGNRYYDYSFDMWSVGCILAGMIFKRDVFFQGEDDLDQLRCIVGVLGCAALKRYLHEYGVDPALPADVVQGRERAVEWFEFVDWGNGGVARDLAVEVVGGLLVMDQRERWTAEECLQHEFFAGLDEEGRVRGCGVAVGGEDGRSGDGSNEESVGKEQGEEVQEVMVIESESDLP
ncbi:Casein kinase II subunit alpha' [Podochytrium sp. JEL0797]|nr:Casein kinase II subunit alpha' [Podochytrium sp. JEL0797]